jgi:hypothetical protein
MRVLHSTNWTCDKLERTHVNESCLALIGKETMKMSTRHWKLALTVMAFAAANIMAYAGPSKEMPPLPVGLAPIVLENELARIRLSVQGALDEFTCRKTGVNYAQHDRAVPIFRAARGGGEVPLRWPGSAGSPVARGAAWRRGSRTGRRARFL